MKIETEGFCKGSQISDKPNEDYILYDDTCNVYVVTDGVTRDRINKEYPNPSPSAEVARLVSEKIYKELKISTNEASPKKIRNSMTAANNVIYNYNQNTDWTFFPGAVCVVATIDKNKLNFGYIGDCVGFRIRNGKKRKFTKAQTELVHKYKKELTTTEIREKICNNKSHPYGYGVLTGQTGAIDFIEVGFIKIKEKDVIVLHTDGMNHLMKEIGAEKILNLNATELINEAEVLEQRNSKIKSDDKGIIIIKIL